MPFILFFHLCRPLSHSTFLNYSCCSQGRGPDKSFPDRSLAALLATGQWPRLADEALVRARSAEALTSGGFNALDWSQDELAAIALNIFLEVRQQQLG